MKYQATAMSVDLSVAMAAVQEKDGGLSSSSSVFQARTNTTQQKSPLNMTDFDSDHDDEDGDVSDIHLSRLGDAHNARMPTSISKSVIPRSGTTDEIDPATMAYTRALTVNTISGLMPNSPHMASSMLGTATTAQSQSAGSSPYRSASSVIQDGLEHSMLSFASDDQDRLRTPFLEVARFLDLLESSRALTEVSLVLIHEP